VEDKCRVVRFLVDFEVGGGCSATWLYLIYMGESVWNACSVVITRRTLR